MGDDWLVQHTSFSVSSRMLLKFPFSSDPIKKQRYDRVPPKICIANMPNSSNKNMESSSTLPIMGTDSKIVPISTRMPGMTDSARNGRSTRMTRMAPTLLTPGRRLINPTWRGQPYSGNCATECRAIMWCSRRQNTRKHLIRLKLGPTQEPERLLAGRTITTVKSSRFQLSFR